MRTTLLVLALLAVAGAFLFGRSTVEAGVSLEDVATLAREAGDSAVTAYLSSDALEEFVQDQLADTVEHYQGEVRAATKIEIVRDPIFITDTLIMPPDTVPIPVGDQVREIAFPTIDTNSVRVEETLFISPRPIFLRRRLRVTFDPDTMIVALLRTPEGLDRFSAALTRSGSSSRVVDAAQLRVKQRSTAQSAVKLIAFASCVLAGYAAAENSVVPTVVGAVVCAGGGALTLFRF